MSNQARAALLLREAANLLGNTSSSGNDNNPTGFLHSNANPRSDIQQVNGNSAESRQSFRPSQLRMASTALFSPYSRNSSNRRRSAPVSLSYWSHRFCVLAKSNQVNKN